MIEASFWEKHKFPNITGIKNNGSRIDFILTSDEWNEIKPDKEFEKGDILSIFENKEIVVYRPIYNSKIEKYEEKELYKFSEAKEKKELVERLTPIYNEYADEDICEKVNDFLNRM